VRHRRIGGSEAAKVMGLSKYGGPIDVYRRLVEGQVDEFDPFLSKRGHLLEPVIRELSRDKFQWSLAPNPGVVLDKQREWCAASPDDLLADQDAGVDYKSVDPRGGSDWGEEGTDQVPIDYLFQAVQYMAVFGKSQWHFAAYFGGNDLRCYTVQRNLDLESAWDEGCSKFWVDHVMAKAPPAPDATEQYGSWLIKRYRSNGTTAAASPEAERWASELRQARLLQEQAETRVREARNHLMALMGEAERLKGDGWSFRYQSRTTTSWKQLAESLGVASDVIAKHTKTSTFATFREDKKK